MEKHIIGWNYKSWPKNQWRFESNELHYLQHIKVLEIIFHLLG